MIIFILIGNVKAVNLDRFKSRLLTFQIVDKAVNFGGWGKKKKSWEEDDALNLQ